MGVVSQLDDDTTVLQSSGESVKHLMDLRSSVRTVLMMSAMAAGMTAAAQTQTPATDQAPAPATPAPAAAPADATPKPWHFAGFDFSGFVDGYYSWNDNHPTGAANGESNDLYNFNVNADQPSLSAVKMTMNHDPAPFGARIDLMYGDTQKLVNPQGQLEYVEQAYLSVKPPKAKGLEVDAGKFVTSAGAEVIEAKDNWNYSRSILFAWAIPYWHFGFRSSMPVSKVDTVGLQVVNGWNNIKNNVGGPTFGITNALVKPKYTWNLNFYTGVNNTDAQHAYKNLIDTTVLLTPNAKFNAYINYDFGQNNDSIYHGNGDNVTAHWQGVAFAAKEQITSKIAGAARFEVFDDAKGYATGASQTLKEFTATYEYHWKVGLLSRAEYRRDWSDSQFFHRGATGMTDSQSTISIGLIAVIAPNR